MSTLSGFSSDLGARGLGFEDIWNVLLALGLFRISRVLRASGQEG